MLKFGFSVSEAGDVDGDGFDDLFVSAPFHDGDAGERVGRAYVIYGGQSLSNLIVGALSEDQGFEIRGIDAARCLPGPPSRMQGM